MKVYILARYSLDTGLDLIKAFKNLKDAEKTIEDYVILAMQYMSPDHVRSKYKIEELELIE